MRTPWMRNRKAQFKSCPILVRNMLDRWYALDRRVDRPDHIKSIVYHANRAAWVSTAISRVKAANLKKAQRDFGSIFGENA